MLVVAMRAGSATQRSMTLAALRRAHHRPALLLTQRGQRSHNSHTHATSSMVQPSLPSRFFTSSSHTRYANQPPRNSSSTTGAQDGSESAASRLTRKRRSTQATAVEPGQPSKDSVAASASATAAVHSSDETRPRNRSHSSKGMCINNAREGGAIALP